MEKKYMIVSNGNNGKGEPYSMANAIYKNKAGLEWLNDSITKFLPGHLAVGTRFVVTEDMVLE